MGGVRRTGANGKSVLLSTVAGILGDYYRTAPIETFTAANGERHPTDLAGLRGARLVSATETEEGRRWAESRIKQLTGGDIISARFMRQDFFEFLPAFKLFIAGNHKPSLRSVDEAIRRRFHLVPFAVTIPADERDGDGRSRTRSDARRRMISVPRLRRSASGRADGAAHGGGPGLSRGA
jgi:putative DNA primase/helicase